MRKVEECLARGAPREEVVQALLSHVAQRGRTELVGYFNSRLGDDIARSVARTVTLLMSKTTPTHRG